MKKNVLLTAEPFAFGPSAKMITICKALNDTCRVTVLGRDIVCDFTSLNSYHAVNYASPSEEEINSCLKGQDVIINVMNFELDKVLRESGIPTIYVDTLFWFWKTDVWAGSNPYHYFCQNFPGTGEAVKQTKATFKDRITLVGPIVDMSYKKKAAQPKHILLNFGGLESDFIKIGYNSNYPYYVVDSFVEHIRQASDLPILVTLRGSLAEMMAEHYRDVETLHFASLSQMAFLNALTQSLCLFTTPGIETIYEAFLYDIPVFFLPPSLNSQYYQLEIYKRYGVAHHRVEWGALIDKGLEQCGFSAQQEIEHILGVMSSPRELELLRINAKTKVTEFLRSLKTAKTQVAKQREFMNRLGENGVNVISNFVYTL